MNCVSATLRRLIAALCGLALAGGPGPAQGQAVLGGAQFELADAVEVERADAATLAHLERVKAYLANSQWDEAIEALRQLSETAENKLTRHQPASVYQSAGVLPVAVGCPACSGVETLSQPRRRLGPQGL